MLFSFIAQIVVLILLIIQKIYQNHFTLEITCIIIITRNKKGNFVRYKIKVIV